MSIKETIKLNGTDAFINIPLSIGNNFMEYQQEIDNATEEAKEESINEVIDYEVRRFIYNVPSETEVGFYFGTGHKLEFGPDGAGFTASEISSNSNKLLNSFFILDFYDSFDNQTQTKIFTTYLTQILDGETDAGEPIPKYIINSETINQLYCWYVPKDYLDPYLYSGYTIVVGYVKFSFYNAKTGKIKLFYNKANDGLSTPEKMYFEAYLYPQTNGWRFSTDSLEVYEVSALSAYAQRVNNRVENFDSLQQLYPNGNVFDKEDGTYFTE